MKFLKFFVFSQNRNSGPLYNFSLYFLKTETLNHFREKLKNFLYGTKSEISKIFLYSPKNKSPKTHFYIFYVLFERALFTLRRFLSYTFSCFFKAFLGLDVKAKSQMGFMLWFKAQPWPNFLFESHSNSQS